MLVITGHTQDMSFSGIPTHILEQEPDRPLQAFTGPFAHLVYLLRRIQVPRLDYLLVQ